MKVSKPALAAVRFGFGLRPGELAPRGAHALLAQIDRPDPAERRFSGPTHADRLKILEEDRRLWLAEKAGKTGLEKRRKALRRADKALRAEDLKVMLLRPMVSRRGFRERLVMFWTNHFAIRAKNRRLRQTLPMMIDDAIRPNIAGPFANLLQAVVRHPAMIAFLNQEASVGPNSFVGRKTGHGLNENLAREILELHTLGVGAGYTQADVTEFAELLTGLSFEGASFRFRPGSAEPGAETVLGRRYGGSKPSLADIDAALYDLSLRPETAHHLARKLAVHFVGPHPDETLVRRMADAYLAANGALPALYEGLLAADDAWTWPGENVKRPHELVVSGFRALGVDPETVMSWNRHELWRFATGPMSRMGQPPFRPPGPDGWPEAPEDWITPVQLAARLNWASRMAETFGADHDPRELVDAALGGLASKELRFLVGGAERRVAGVALILASPAFNRR